MLSLPPAKCRPMYCVAADSVRISGWTGGRSIRVSRKILPCNIVGYFIIIAAIIVFGLGFWLTRVIKRAWVQPIAPDGKPLDARLSEKKRYTAIVEAHGFAIGFLTALGLVALALWWASN